MTYRKMSFVLAFGLVLATAAAVRAQNVDVYKDEFEDRLHQQGDSFTLCVNSTSMMAGFEKALAQSIGDTLLVDVKVQTIDPLAPDHPLDTILPYTADQLYIIMAEQCDGFMGFVLAANYPDWLTVTRPYLVTDNLLVTKSAAYTSLNDVPKNLPIGSRMGSDGDASLLNYLLSLPDSQQWHRYAYGDNSLLFKRVLDGTVGAGMIWEPALDFATKGDPSSNGLKVINTPFSVGKTQIGIGVRSNDSYLKTELSEAIPALVKDGTVDKLLAQFKMVSPTSVPQTSQNQ